MMMIADALSDLKNIALSGKPLPFAEVAADYDINPKLLERKWNESYPNGVVAPLMTEKQMIEKALLDTILRMCAKYNVPVSETKVVTFKGKPFTVIGTRPGSKRFHYLAVSHQDGRAYNLTNINS